MLYLLQNSRSEEENKVLRMKLGKLDSLCRAIQSKLDYGDSFPLKSPSDSFSLQVPTNCCGKDFVFALIAS